MRPRERRRKRFKAAGDDSAVLPPEILDLIILHLPPIGIVRARSVCRSWNEAIRSSSFAERKAKLDHELGRVPDGWLLTMFGRYKKKWVWLYDPHVGRRYKIMFPPQLKGTFYHATVVGGLLFLEIGHSYQNGICLTKLCAWNPITGFMKELVIPHTKTYAAVATILSHRLYPLQPNDLMDQSIFSAGDVAAGKWNRINFLSFRVHNLWGTYSNGFLYRTKCFRDRTITALNMRTSESIGIDLPPQLERASRWGIRLVECNGHLLLLAACTPSRRKVDHMQLWKLRPPPEVGWVWLSMMPEDLFTLVFKGAVNQHNWRCTSVGHLVIISSSHRRVHEPEGVAVFDMQKQSWRQVENVFHERQYCPWATPYPFYPTFASLES